MSEEERKKMDEQIQSRVRMWNTVQEAENRIKSKIEMIEQYRAQMEVTDEVKTQDEKCRLQYEQFQTISGNALEHNKTLLEQLATTKDIILRNT